MGKKLVSIMFAAMVLGSLCIPVSAIREGGVLHVSLDAGELPVTNGAITLYQVGLPVQEGYWISEIFGGGIVKREDAESAHLALWLAEAAGDSGRTINLDVDGNVTFSNLEEGLYLVVQTERMDGFYPIQPFLAVIPEGSGQEIRAYPKTEPIMTENPQTGQPIAPLLGAMGMVASGIGLYFCFDSKRRK